MQESTKVPRGKKSAVLRVRRLAGKRLTFMLGAEDETLREFAEKHACTIGDLEPLVQVAVDDRRLVRLTQQIAIDLDALDALRRSLAEHFQKHATVKVSEIRELWGITRKHAIPILEFFDRYLR